MSSSRKLLLFDIDGTLLDTGGAGLRSLSRGFLEAFEPGIPESEFPPLNLGGATDLSIVEFLFPQFEIEQSPDNIDRFFSVYLGHLESELNNLGRNTPLQGTKPLLDFLAAETDHVLGLLTGNIARGAFKKVNHFGLHGFFEFGAFGDDHADRNQLGSLGITRATEYSGNDFHPDDVFIIGDTPKDIACARACGAKAVAVSTGGFSKPKLEKLDPDFLFDDLETHQEEFLGILQS